MESLLGERAQDKEKIKELEEEVRSRTGSQGTAEEEPAAPAEERTPAAAEEEKGEGTPAKEKDPHLTAVGPVNEGSFAKGRGREDPVENEFRREPFSTLGACLSVFCLSLFSSLKFLQRFPCNCLHLCEAIDLCGHCLAVQLLKLFLSQFWWS